MNKIEFTNTSKCTNHYKKVINAIIIKLVHHKPHACKGHHDLNWEEFLLSFLHYTLSVKSKCSFFLGFPSGRLKNAMLGMLTFWCS